jgi:VCBS repeat-containing protein
MGVYILLGGTAPAAVLTMQTNVLGPTPDLLAYNSGHFFPGSNTRDWWRYAGVSGARMFISPNSVEFSDDLPPVGDGVTNQTSFLARRAALRADPLNTNYINWPYFLNRYQNTDLYPNNHIRINYAVGELRQLGIQLCAQIQASEVRFPITNASDWGGKWELWQHFYAQAFYLGREFDVERFMMFNEPNHPNANGLTLDNYLMRLQLASDAIQSALADMNTIYGRALSVRILAPVTAGSATSAYPDWGRTVVTNRHTDFLGVTDPNFWLTHIYAYQSYGSTPAGFGSSLASLHSLLEADMHPEPRFPTAITEFNTRTGATYDSIPETLDSPAEYARFGAIAVQLMANECRELYAFKFSQTEYSGNYPVQKNAMHYVDNHTSPYHIGGITKAGEVWRLFNKAFAPGRLRLNVLKGAGTTGLDVQASYDPATARYYLFSANNTAGSVALDLSLAAWNLPVGNRALIEEVSENASGTITVWTNLDASRTVSGVQPAYSVWLLTVSALAQSGTQTLVATDDAEVRDGIHANSNFGGATAMTARNDPATVNHRSAAFLKFDLADVDLADLQFAELVMQASSATVNTTAQAHVYGLTTPSWSQNSITWNTAPNLRTGVPAGNTIIRNVVAGQGTNAFILGQLVTTITTPAEKRLEVTAFLRHQTNGHATFLISQDPRWNVALPSLETGDTQPDGVKITTTESGAGPRLRLIFAVPNTPPTAADDAYFTEEDTFLVVAAPGVLTNDLDAEPNALTAVLVNDVSHGTLALNPNGGFTYQPDSNYFGLDSFTYRAHDGLTSSAPATVTITVTAVNDPPVAVNDNALLLRNTSVVIDVLANDYDVDGDALQIVSFTQGNHGGVTATEHGTLIYTPPFDFTGNDSFTYTISDGQGGTNSATVNLTVVPPGEPPYWTNLPAAAEAFIRGGGNANSDQDEVATGYLMVKHIEPGLDLARKAYFQFNLSGVSLNANTAATFTVTTHTQTFRHRAQLWGLNQDYPAFNATITWNSAQANETNSNNLLTAGAFTASPIGNSHLFPGTALLAHDFTVARLGDFLFNERVTLALSGVADATNDAGGLRLARTNATLQVLITPPAPPATNLPPVITGISDNGDSSVTLSFGGNAGWYYLVQATTDLTPALWVRVSTNLAGPDGAWTFTDFAPTNLPQRFYRAALP